MKQVHEEVVLDFMRIIKAVVKMIFLKSETHIAPINLVALV